MLPGVNSVCPIDQSCVFMRNSCDRNRQNIEHFACDARSGDTECLKRVRERKSKNRRMGAREGKIGGIEGRNTDRIYKIRIE